jgi:hypothetical protein
MRKRWEASLEHGSGDEFLFTSQVVGSNMILVDAVHKRTGSWTGVFAGQKIVRPGLTEIFPIVFCEWRGSGSLAREEENVVLTQVEDFFVQMGSEDIPLLESMRYSPGYMTRQDRLLIKYLKMIREYPRAHPSARFIRMGGSNNYGNYT